LDRILDALTVKLLAEVCDIVTLSQSIIGGAKFISVFLTLHHKN